MSSSDHEQAAKRSKSEEASRKKEKKEEKRKRMEEEEKRRKEEPSLSSMMGFMKEGFGNLQGTVGGMQHQLAGVAGQMTGLTAELLAFKSETHSKFVSIEESLKLHAEQIAQLQAAPASSQQPAASGSSGVSSLSTGFVPKNKRKIIVVRRFPWDTLSADIEAELRVLLADVANVHKITAPGKLSSMGKVIFKDSDAMWAFLVSMKGKKLISTKYPNAKLFHKIDETTEERLLGKQTSHMVNAIRTFALEKNIVTEASMKKAIDGDWDRGFVYAKIGDAPAVRFIEFDKPATCFTKCSGAATLGWDFDFDLLAQETSNITLGR